jgi:hypothetical protein
MGSHHFRDYLRKGRMFRTEANLARPLLERWATKCETFAAVKMAVVYRPASFTLLYFPGTKRIYLGETVSTHPPSVTTPKLINIFQKVWQSGNKMRSRGMR